MYYHDKNVALALAYWWNCDKAPHFFVKLTGFWFFSPIFLRYTVFSVSISQTSTNYLQSTKVHDCNNLRKICQEFTPLRLDRRTAASPLKLDATSSHLFANKLKWKIKNDSKTALKIDFFPRLSENRREASCSLDVGAFSALWEEEEENVCVLLAGITSLNVALGFWEGTGKTWKQRLCFLPLGFCGLSLLTGSCRHFGYARREWQPHWSAFPEVEGKSKQTGKTLVVYHRRSCLFDTQQGCFCF